MRNFMDRFITKRRHLVVAEDDVLKTLKTINKYHRVVPEMAVGSCGWFGSNKWFIHFTTTNSKWETIRKELNVVRVFGDMDIPDSDIGVVYSTD